MTALFLVAAKPVIFSSPACCCSLITRGQKMLLLMPKKIKGHLSSFFFFTCNLFQKNILSSSYDLCFEYDSVVFYGMRRTKQIPLAYIMKMFWTSSNLCVNINFILLKELIQYVRSCYNMHI